MVDPEVVNASRFALALLAVGCGARPLAPSSGGGTAGDGAPPTAGGAGAGGGPGGSQAGGAPETGCAWVQASDCPGAETGTLSGLQIADRGADGTVSAGEAATVSVTLTAGDQGFSYPSIGLTDDNPLVTISPSLPLPTVYALSPHAQLEGTFDVLVDPSVAPGTVVHFTACPAILDRFCGNGARFAFDVMVGQPMTPAWTVTTGPPQQFPPCGSLAADAGGVCRGVGQVALSNPRAVFSHSSTTLLVGTSVWLTNGGSSSQTLCVRAAFGDRPSYVTQQDVDPGKSADVELTAIDLGWTPPSGTPLHLAVWTGGVQANCPNAGRIDFDTIAP